MTRRSHPMRNSAPLPADMDIRLPSPGAIQAEITRASAELMWAIHRQRTAWAHFAKLKKHYDSQPNFQFLDNERPWAMAIADVKWWRGEVTSRATTLQALIELARSSYPDLGLGGNWVETTTFGDHPNRTFVSAGDGSLHVRETVMAWRPGTPATEAQRRCAQVWMELTGADMSHRGRMHQGDWKHCVQLLQAR